LGNYYAGKTTGMCQNMNGDIMDDRTDCIGNDVTGIQNGIDSISDSCSCALDDKKCLKSQVDKQ
jgi:hypothetical protein